MGYAVGTVVNFTDWTQVLQGISGGEDYIGTVLEYHEPEEDEHFGFYTIEFNGQKYHGVDENDVWI